MKAYITKYALSSGVFEIEGHISDISENMFCSDRYELETYHGNDWHLNREDAVKRAEEMRRRKINSLERQIDKLIRMEFN